MRGQKQSILPALSGSRWTMEIALPSHLAASPLFNPTEVLLTVKLTMSVYC
jgi:hypothetical protein